MDTKIIGLILLFCSALLIHYEYENVFFSFLAPEKKLQSKIEKDTLTNLKQVRPKHQLSIHHVELSYRSKVAHEFLQKHQPKFETTKNGSVWIEIEVIDLPDQVNPGIITQTSVFDMKTNNKISEYGQTYYLKNFKRK
ncbi:MAG: hypothetical protein IPM97_13005 [Bdellovibrionaceae bacterium]|nr:hypothetical protein [Pseudobdellovibrionaceae bacterium]